MRGKVRSTKIGQVWPVTVLSDPVTLYVDGFVVGAWVSEADPLPTNPIPADGEPAHWDFAALAVLAGIAALFCGLDAVWTHLASPLRGRALRGGTGAGGRQDPECGCAGLSAS